MPFCNIKFQEESNKITGPLLPSSRPYDNHDFWQKKHYVLNTKHQNIQYLGKLKEKFG